jgi:hypothetical protein
MDNKFFHENFDYESCGMLRCRIPGRDPYPWKPAGSLRQYLQINVGNEKLYLHRLIWQFHHGEVPARIDHRNGDTGDNRIENLRLCTAAENQYNSKRKKNNRSGAKGVVLHKACRSRPWQAKIVVDKKVISLGYYATVEEASDAYAQGAEKFAGAFARRG